MSSFILPPSTTGSGWICPSMTRMDRLRQCSFLQGYVVEKSLGLDNVFVIAMIFTYFRIPSLYQHRVLFWGVVGALAMRAVMNPRRYRVDRALQLDPLSVRRLADRQRGPDGAGPAPTES